MEVAYLSLENAALICELLDQISNTATKGILGNARSSLVDIKTMADEAKRVYLESKIKTI